MRFSLIYSWATIICITSNWPPVTANGDAVIPRQDTAPEMREATPSISNPSSSVAPSSNAAASASASSSFTPSASRSPARASSTPTSEESVASGSSSASMDLATATPIANMTSNGTVTKAPHIDGLPIHPQITPALSVAGTILILSGVFYTLIGIKTKWLHIFLSTVYLFSLSVTVLIIYVMHPPVSNAIQGAYFVAACVTGIVFGAIAVVFADVTEGFGCFLGGFCLSMWFLVLKPGGLVPSTAGKAIFIACFTVCAFSLYVSHYTRPYGLIGSTSFAGATVVVLGVDMFSRAGLKEFWLYIWDLNRAEFPLHYEGPYPITRGIRVEIACIVLLSLLGIMSQLKVWKIIKQRREQRAAEQRRKDEERDQAEEDLGRKLEEGNGRDRAMWDAVYGSKEKGKGSQVDSGIGTDEPSTRKGSMSVADVRLSPEEGMEMLNFAGSSHGSQKGRVTVHVAQDDGILRLPPLAAHKPITLLAESLKEPSVHEPQVGAYHHDISETSSVRNSTSAPKKDPQTLIDPNLARRPKLVPLPFKVPTEETQQDDDVSSLATFAATEYLPDPTRKRASGLSLIRRLSGRSKRKSNITSTSEEHLIIPHIEDDRASSVMAMLDGVSIHENSSGEALSSKRHTRDLSEAQAGSTVVDTERLQNPEAVGIINSDVPGVARPVAGSVTPQVVQDGEGLAMGQFGGSPGLKAGEDENVTTRTQVPGDELSTTPKAPEQQAKQASLADNLPAGASKVVMAYRTNEWAKHLDNAEPPVVEDINISKAQSAISPEANEISAPVDVEALQQTALTAELGPIIVDRTGPIGDRVQASSLDRSPSTNPTNPYLKRKQAPPPEAASASHINLATRNVEPASSQTSLSSGNSHEEISSRPLAPRQRSQSSTGPSRGFRNSSAPILGTTLAKSPIEEDVESSFPARFTPSPMHLLSQRDTILRNKPSTTSLLEHNALSTTKGMLSGDSSHNAMPAGAASPNMDNDDDNIPLSRRRSLLLQQQQHQQPPYVQRAFSGGTTAYYTPATTPPNLTRNSSRISLAQIRPSEPPKRDSAVTAWRASLAADPSNTTSVVQNAEIEQRRTELLADKRRTKGNMQQAQMAENQRRVVVDKEMRRGSMLDAHREAMRRMQGQVNKSFNNGSPL
ncbi:MAG: hypothetical protein Q9163_002593 [Psora crenata]